MKYYFLNTEYNHGLEGDQSSEMVGINSSEAHNSLRSFFRNEPFYTPKVSPFLLKKKAELTTCISSSRLNPHTGFIFNNVFFEFLLKFKVKEYWEIPVELTFDRNYQKLIDGYNLFVIPESIFSYVDFSNSSFYMKDIMGTNGETYLDKIVLKSVNSINIFHKTKKEWHHTLDYEKLVIKKECDFDLFRLGHRMGGYYVSENLKEAIESEGFTGLKFMKEPRIVIQK